MGIALVITMAAVITTVDQPIEEALQGDHVIAVDAELGANLR
jgi:hypothetical protein